MVVVQVEVEQRPADTVGLREAARILGISPEGVRKRVLRGHLPASKDADGAWLVERAALEHPPTEVQPPPNPSADCQSTAPDGLEPPLVVHLQQENQRL